MKQPWIVPNSTHTSWGAKKMWLDEIEEILQEEREFTEGQLRNGYDETSCERMARVIRELAAIVKHVRDYELCPDGIQKLSDEAKELLG